MEQLDVSISFYSDKGREENLHKDNTTYFSTNLVEQHDPTLIQGSSASSLSAQV